MAEMAQANILRHSDASRSLDIYQHTFSHIAEIKDNSSFRRFEARALARSAAHCSSWAVRSRSNMP